MERPGAFPVAGDDPGFVEEPKVARDARLGLPEDLAEVADGALSVPEQGDDPEPGRLGDRAKGGEARVEVRSLGGVTGHGETI